LPGQLTLGRVEIRVCVKVVLARRYNDVTREAIRATRGSGCIYPQSHATASDIFSELDGLAANRTKCTSIYLPTAPGMSESGEDHYQGLARTQKLSDGSVYFFLAHSDVDLLGFQGHGSLLQYRYAGPTADDHVLESSPPTYATLEQLLLIDDDAPEQHPSDIAFLPDVNELDAGYLFVTEEYDNRRVTVYRWEPGHDLVVQARIFAGFPTGGPQFVFVDRVGDDYFLGIASQHWGWGQLFRAPAERLFAKCAKGSMSVVAFRSDGMFPFPVTEGPSQTKLIRDVNGDWFLLGFRSDPNDDEHGTDYIDVFGVRFDPFVISYKLGEVHISFRAGDTGFASTGTHHVDKAGKLLVSSSYRWDRLMNPIQAPWIVCRVDELPSS
jgi:hypothetical protein